MDIFLLLLSRGWCVNQFYFIFSLYFSFFFNFSGCNFKISFSFSWVATLGIRRYITPSNQQFQYHWIHRNMVPMLGEHITLVVGRLDPKESHEIAAMASQNL